MASKVEVIKELIDSAELEKLQDAILEIIDFNEKGVLLKYAIESQDKECVKVLIDAGCDPCYNVSGMSGFSCAIFSDNLDILELLIEDYMWLIDMKKEMCQEDENSNHQSGMMGTWLKYLISGAKCNKDRKGITHKPKRPELQRLKTKIDSALSSSIFEASCNGSIKCLERLLDLGVNPNTFQYHPNEMLSWCSPLVAACAGPVNEDGLARGELYVKCVEVLVQYGADVGVTTPYGQSALHWACKSGLVDAVHLLWRNGADIDLKDKMEYTPLMTTADSSLNGLEVCKHLIQWGADLSLRGEKEDFTAFHFAVGNGNAELAEFFLEEGISPNTGTDNKELAIAGVSKARYLPYMQSMAPIDIAVLNENISLVKLILQAYADVNIPSHYNETTGGMVYLAMDCPDVFRLLVEAGLNLKNIRDPRLPEVIKNIVKECRQDVKSLKHLTRLVIRDAIAMMYRERDQLPLPKVLLSYIDMKDEFDAIEV